MSGHGVAGGGDPSIVSWLGFVELSTLDSFSSCQTDPMISFRLSRIPNLPSRDLEQNYFFHSWLLLFKARYYAPKMAQPVQTEVSWDIIQALDMILFLTELKMH